MTAKLERILLTFSSCEMYQCKTAAELYALCDRLEGGVVVFSGLRDTSVNDIKNALSLDWDIVAILPSGAPVPFYSSNLTAFTAPVNVGEFTSHLRSLLNVGDYRQTDYGKGKADAISRAKQVIIKREHISESEAHYLLQRMSMDRGVPLKKLAEMIASGDI